jgi:hypothetical protein
MAQIAKNFTDKSLFNPAFKLNNVNVPTLGQINSLLQAAGVILGMGGQDDIGKRLCIADIDGPDWSLAATGTLFGGIYQAVQVDAGATAANIFPGAAAYLLDTATGGGANSGSNGYVVTDSAHALATNLGCGVFLNAITPGQFGFIQISGKATVKYTAAPASLVAGCAVVFKGVTAGTFDTVLDATAITGALLSAFVGNSIQAPAANALGTIFIKTLLGRY